MKLGCWSKEIAFLLPVLLKQTKNHFFFKYCQRKLYYLVKSYSSMVISHASLRNKREKIRRISKKMISSVNHRRRWSYRTMFGEHIGRAHTNFADPDCFWYKRTLIFLIDFIVLTTFIRHWIRFFVYGTWIESKRYRENGTMNKFSHLAICIKVLRTIIFQLNAVVGILS